MILQPVLGSLFGGGAVGPPRLSAPFRCLGVGLQSASEANLFRADRRTVLHLHGFCFVAIKPDLADLQDSLLAFMGGAAVGRL